MKIPSFFLVDAVPVKVVETDDGGLDVLRYVAEDRRFRRAMEYLERIVFAGGDSGVEAISESSFASYIAELDAMRGR